MIVNRNFELINATSWTNKRTVVGMDAVWDIEQYEVELNDPSLDRAPACGDTSSRCGREEGEPFVRHQALQGRRVARRTRDRELIQRQGRGHRACAMPRCAAVFHKGWMVLGLYCTLVASTFK